MGHESDKGEFMNHSCAPNCRELRLLSLRQGIPAANPAHLGSAGSVQG
jgi:SET domain-containing protein